MRLGKYKVLIVLFSLFFLLSSFSGCGIDNDDSAVIDDENEETADEEERYEITGEFQAPKYPGAEEVDLSENGGREYVLYQTTDAMEDVLAFYQDEFSDYYLTQEEEGLYYLAPIHMEDMQEKAEKISGEEVLLFAEEEGLVIIQVMRFNGE